MSYVIPAKTHHNNITDITLMLHGASYPLKKLPLIPQFTAFTLLMGTTNSTIQLASSMSLAGY